MCDPDLDIGVKDSKKTKDPKTVGLLPGSGSEPTLTPPDLRAMTNASDWVGIIQLCLTPVK